MWTNDVNGARSRSNASRTRIKCLERGARSPKRRSSGPGQQSKKSSQHVPKIFCVPRQKSASETTWSSQRRALHTHAEVRLTSTSLSSRYAPTCFFSLRAPRTPPSRAAGPAPRRERLPGLHVGFPSDTFRRFGNRSRFARFARAMPPVEDAAVSFVADRRASRRAREETRRPTNAFPPIPPDTDPFRSDPRDASRNISTQPS